MVSCLRMYWLKLNKVENRIPRLGEDYREGNNHLGEYWINYWKDRIFKTIKEQ